MEFVERSAKAGHGTVRESISDSRSGGGESDRLVAGAPRSACSLVFGGRQGGSVHATALAEEADQMFVADRELSFDQLEKVAVRLFCGLHSAARRWFAGHDQAVPVKTVRARQFSH